MPDGPVCGHLRPGGRHIVPRATTDQKQKAQVTPRTQISHMRPRQSSPYSPGAEPCGHRPRMELAQEGAKAAGRGERAAHHRPPLAHADRCHRPPRHPVAAAQPGTIATLDVRVLKHARPARQHPALQGDVRGRHGASISSSSTPSASSPANCRRAHPHRQRPGRESYNTKADVASRLYQEAGGTRGAAAARAGVPADRGLSERCR
jgi:hypothetical protein